MRRWGIVVLAWVGAGCYTSGTGFSTDPFNNRERAERRAAQYLVPVDLEVPRGTPIVSKTFTVRAWVDADYRQKPRWRAQVQELMNRVSAFTSPAFGASFEVDIRTWERSGDATMDEMLSTLIDHDNGDDVDWVVGFVTAPQALTTDHHLIGLAQPMGKHFVLRDMNDAQEARELDSVFDKLGAAERAELYASRKRHKLLTTFMHEWSHTLGHPHEQDPTMVMSSSESNRSSRFSEPGAHLLRASVAWRAGGPMSASALAEVRRLLAENGALWREFERQQAMAAIDQGQVASIPASASASASRSTATRARTTPTSTPQAPSAAPRPGGPPPAREPVAHVQVPDAASVAALAPMPVAAPTHPVAKELTGTEAVRAVVRHAYDRYQQGDHAGARGDLDTVRARLAPGSNDWENALQIYLAIGALSRVGELLQGHDGPREADSRRMLERLRHDTGLGDPGRSGVTAEDEPEVFALFIDGISKIAADDLAAAEGRRRELAGRFPRALPTMVLACAVEAASGKMPAARKDCASANARWDELTYAHFWAGQAATSVKERIAHHKRTLEIDPAQEGSWQALAALYRQSGDRTAEAALRKDFEAKFGRALTAP
jgi:hypothetical protein